MKVFEVIREDRRLDPANEVAVGVEVELEGCQYNLGLDRTRTVGGVPLEYGIDAHRDGSLRRGGIELVTKPIRGRHIKQNVEYICKLAESQGWVTSNRAGIHIHVDVQQLELTKLLNFLKVYTLVEPALFNFASDGRENSIYCKAWHDVDIEGVHLFIDETGDLDKGNISQWSELGTRYLGLNLNSCRRYGTLEFRHLRSTLNSDRILRWIELLLQAREYAVNEDITRTLVNRFTPTSVLATIFGDLRLYYPEFDSYFYHRSLPLCNDLFWPARKPVQWTNGQAKQKKPHPGFQKFTKKTKLESKPNPAHLNPWDGQYVEQLNRILAAGRRPPRPARRAVTPGRAAMGINFVPMEPVQIDDNGNMFVDLG